MASADFSTRAHILLVEEQEHLCARAATQIAALDALCHRCETMDAALAVLNDVGRQASATELVVLLGWPKASSTAFESLRQKLESPTFADIRVIVLTEHLSPQVRAFVANRRYTHILSWSDSRRLPALTLELVQQRAPLRQMKPATTESSNLRVLVVDDSPSVCISLRNLLAHEGFVVSICNSFSEACAHLREHHTDILLSDFYLGAQTAEQLMHWVGTQRELSTLLMAVITGSYCESLVLASLRAGAIDVLVKSESSQILLARMQSMAQQVMRLRRTQMWQDTNIHTPKDNRSIGGTLLIDERGQIRFANASARVTLGLANPVATTLQSGLSPASARLLQHTLSTQKQAALLHHVQTRHAPEQSLAMRLWPLLDVTQNDGYIVEFSAPSVTTVDDAASTLSGTTLEHNICYVALLVSVYICVRNAKPVGLNKLPHLQHTIEKLLRRMVPADRLSTFSGADFRLILAHQQHEDPMHLTQALMIQLQNLFPASGPIRMQASAALYSLNQLSDAYSKTLADQGVQALERSRAHGHGAVYVADRDEIVSLH